eukprot:CAMPEP_0194148068 /NCGR_PEP_ID=MMETSP0152-20130528/29938_1 /TAXON_ID=1049557 /ORGANISM="Thalassiothrix antarctica, Strain L6-D1" /LENGTH=429 /DNA_ID=CAMNT_0038849345 /DNA_START=37 /DNA_END=1323 /DNA_ORIENTATION=+
MSEEELIDTYRPGKKESIEDVIMKLREERPSRLRFCATTGLSMEQIAALNEAIPKSITELRLSNCQHSFVVCALEKLKSTPIKKLYLFDIKINAQIMKIIGELLELNQGLIEVNVKDNSVESEGISLIANGIRHHSTLERLDLSNSLADRMGKDILLDAMQQNSSIQALNLSGKVLESSTSNKALGVMLRQNGTLKELDLCQNSLQNDEVIEMADTLRLNNKSLSTLRLANTGLGHHAAIAIGQMLAKNTTLTLLDVGGNQFGYLGAIAIVEGIRCLQHLDLRSTRLGITGSKAICKMLRTNHTLRSLNLSRNNFGDEGAVNVVDGLIFNTELRSLSLSMCSITRTGAIYLGRKLHAMSGIKQLFLFQNSIDKDGFNALLQGLKDNVSLVDLGIEKRYLSSSDELSLYLKLNRIGRCVLREPDLPDGLW